MRPAIVESRSVPLDVSYRLVLPSADPPSSGFPLVVALHGYGDDGAVFEERLAVGEAPYACLFADAPYPVTVERGDGRRVGRSWYAYDGNQDAYRLSLQWAERFVLDLLDDVLSAHPLDATRVSLLGYSQGGYVASYCALRHRKRFAGLVAISCRVKVEWLASELESARGFPVLGVHGRRDRFTEYEPQVRAFDVLRDAGLSVEWLGHDFGHGIKSETVPVIDDFLRRCAGLAS